MSSAVQLFVLLFLCGIYCEACERNGTKCPDYTVLEKHEDYEERQYPSLVWLSTSALASSRREISRQLIKRLYGYLGGENDKAINIDMMVPVRTSKVPVGKKFNYTMSLIVDPVHHDSPPEPTNPLLVIEREPETVYFVRSFGGMARDENIWDNEAERLRTSLAGERDADTSTYYRCAYDSPWKEENRLNEVWFRRIERSQQ